MKKLICISVFLIGCFSSVAQVPGVNFTSASGSVAIEVPLLPLALVVEPRLEKEVKDFREIYEHRSEYYARTVLDGGVIINQVDDLRARVNLLLADNAALAFFYPFKKRDNRIKLEAMITSINRLDNELRGLLPDSIYGERINLNQNVEIILEQMHRRADEIESDIAKSRILSQLLGL